MKPAVVNVVPMMMKLLNVVADYTVGTVIVLAMLATANQRTVRISSADSTRSNGGMM